jgi:hypothetical protein
MLQNPMTPEHQFFLLRPEAIPDRQTSSIAPPSFTPSVGRTTTTRGFSHALALVAVGPQVDLAARQQARQHLAAHLLQLAVHVLRLLHARHLQAQQHTHAPFSELSSEPCPPVCPLCWLPRRLVYVRHVRTVDCVSEPRPCPVAHLLHSAYSSHTLSSTTARPALSHPSCLHATAATTH